MKTYSKSQAAFVLSVRKLFEESPRVYFWTFTFVQVMPDWYYPRSWDVFIKRLGNCYGGHLQGLRVLEVHPGGHGLHYHALLNKRISVHLVRRFTDAVGMGIVQVDTATPESAEYLAKYLCKQNPLTTGMRRWGTLGGFRQIKKANIEVDSLFHRNFRELNPMGVFVPIEIVQWCWRMTALYGDIADWRPSQIKLVDSQGIPDTFRSETRSVSNGNGNVVTLSYNDQTPRKPYVLDLERKFLQAKKGSHVCSS